MSVSKALRRHHARALADAGRRDACRGREPVSSRAFARDRVGDHRVSGGFGDDIIKAGSGKDKIDCGRGHDIAIVKGDDDTVSKDCEVVKVAGS